MRTVTPEPIRIGNVRFTASSPRENESGLVGWVSCSVNPGLHLDGLALRRTAEGRLTLSFPARRDGSGRQHFYVRPLDERTRGEIQHQVLAALGLQEAPLP